MHQNTLPPLTTKRLSLRKLQFIDDKAIFALRNNEQVNTYIQRPLLNSIQDARHFIEAINEGIEHKEWLYWAMILKDTHQLIGTICLWHFSIDQTTAEIGYELHPDFQGKGLMQEALQKVIEYGFTTLHLKTIEAFTQPDNEKSLNLLKKNNFHPAPVNNNVAASREIRFALQKPIS